MSVSAINNNLLQFDNLQLPSRLQVVLIYTEWNETIVNELVAGAERILQGIPEIQIIKQVVPGAVELTYAAALHLQSTLKPHAVVVLGCVIRGETPHFDYVCQSVTQGITHLNSQGILPVIFGVLTVNSEKEAHDRLGGKHGHKGEEAAIAALKMASLR